MSNVKISELPAASTFTRSTAVLPIVNSGITKQLAMAKIAPIFNVKDFGAAGDGVSDDTTAIQSAITACKAAGNALFFPAGSYIVTSSLDATGTTATANFWMIGESRRKSIILANLTEAYPAVDMCGNTRGGIKSLSIDASSSTSATACVLMAKSAAGGSIGNNQNLEDCYLKAAGNATANMAALVVYNADLTRVSNCEVYGNTGGGATFGFGKPSSVTSKFITLSSAQDSTNFYITDSQFNGAAAPALEYMGGSAINLSNVYAALTGTGGANGMFQVSAGGGTGGNTVIATDLRTENQSSATGKASIYLTADSNYSTITGALEGDASGYMVASSAAINAKHWVMNVAATSPAFANTVKFNVLRGVIQCPSIGTPDSSSYGIKVAMPINASSFYGALLTGTGNDLTRSNNNLDYRSLDSVFIHPSVTGSPARPAGKVTQTNTAWTSYTGGSGEALVWTATLNGGLIYGLSTAWAKQVLEYEHIFQCNNSGASGRIRVNLIQGAGNVDVLDTGANISAFNPGKGRLTVKIFNLSTDASRVYAELFMSTATGSTVYQCNAFTNTQATISLATGDFTLNIYETNTASDPYTSDVYHVSLK